MSRRIPVFHADIPCPLCNALFTPSDRRQKYCFPCIQQSHICVDCGTEKRSRGPRCKKCAILNSIDRPKPKNRRAEKPIEQIIFETEAIGLLPEKQYAFGYVAGVIFGDGTITKQTSSIPYTRSDGTIAYHPSTVYLCRLSVTSQAFAERYAKQWEALTGRPAKVSSTIRKNFSKSTLKGRREGYKVQLFEVDPAHALLGRYLKHLKYESDRSFLLRFPLEVMRGFVHGMIDSEGYVCKTYTDIANKDIALLNTLVVMLERLGQNATVYTSPSQSVAHLRTFMIYSKYGHNMHYATPR